MRQRTCGAPCAIAGLATAVAASPTEARFRNARRFIKDSFFGKLLSSLLQDLVRRRRYDLDVLRNEFAALDVFDEFRLDLVRQNLADAGMLLDIGPLRNQKEPLRVLGVAAQHAVLHLCRG